MIDRVGLIGANQTARVNPVAERTPAGGVAAEPGAPSFKDALMDNLKKVNQLQQDATTAIEDLQTGKRNDLETVLMATQKADTAFKMLLAVRNKVVEAYDEIRQIRV
jgi:flagellar hook-basal body complex protein FliE